jgi:hypothetical protein
MSEVVSLHSLGSLRIQYLSVFSQVEEVKQYYFDRIEEKIC